MFSSGALCFLVSLALLAIYQANAEDVECYGEPLENKYVCMKSDASKCGTCQASDCYKVYLAKQTFRFCGINAAYTSILEEVPKLKEHKITLPLKEDGCIEKTGLSICKCTGKLCNGAHAQSAASYVVVAVASIAALFARF